MMLSEPIPRRLQTNEFDIHLSTHKPTDGWNVWCSHTLLSLSRQVSNSLLNPLEDQMLMSLRIKPRTQHVVGLPHLKCNAIQCKIFSANFQFGQKSNPVLSPQQRHRRYVPLAGAAFHTNTDFPCINAASPMFTFPKHYNYGHGLPLNTIAAGVCRCRIDAVSYAAYRSLGVSQSLIHTRAVQSCFVSDSFPRRFMFVDSFTRARLPFISFHFYGGK